MENDHQPDQQPERKYRGGFLKEGELLENSQDVTSQLLSPPTLSTSPISNHKVTVSSKRLSQQGIESLVLKDQMKHQIEMNKQREKAVLVDRISRWLFPASFILLNIVYWALFGDYGLWWRKQFNLESENLKTCVKKSTRSSMLEEMIFDNKNKSDLTIQFLRVKVRIFFSLFFAWK